MNKQEKPNAVIERLRAVLAKTSTGAPYALCNPDDLRALLSDYAHLADKIEEMQGHG